MDRLPSGRGFGIGSYIRLANVRVGLLINFNVPVLKDGIIRRVM
ncbi:MAG: GxxExxY protein [Pirellulales bacterium]